MACVLRLALVARSGGSLPGASALGLALPRIVLGVGTCVRLRVAGARAPGLLRDRRRLRDLAWLLSGRRRPGGRGCPAGRSLRWGLRRLLGCLEDDGVRGVGIAVSYTHLRAHETDSYLVCRLLLE